MDREPAGEGALKGLSVDQLMEVGELSGEYAAWRNGDLDVRSRDNILAAISDEAVKNALLQRMSEIDRLLGITS